MVYDRYIIIALRYLVIVGLTKTKTNTENGW